VQFLASRGFAVFHPNFRGSSGYGRAFEVAGYRQWGLAMQDDVTDGVKWLIAQGIADPDRIGIYGASYGGYAAMMGLVREPGVFRAGTSYAGVMSLPVLLDENEWQGLDDHNVPMIGGGWSDRKRLTDTSPLEHVSAIASPVLLGHGENDQRVHVKHSRRMEDALRDAGKAVEYLEFEEEVHGFLLEANRIRWYSALAAFFEKHLAPRATAAPAS
jgi:dipeptidyl aminopeptidase/acylaminoacyl peptidase